MAKSNFECFARYTTKPEKKKGAVLCYFIDAETLCPLAEIFICSFDPAGRPQYKYRYYGAKGRQSECKEIYGISLDQSLTLREATRQGEREVYKACYRALGRRGFHVMTASQARERGLTQRGEFIRALERLEKPAPGDFQLAFTPRTAEEQEQIRKGGQHGYAHMLFDNRHDSVLRR